MTTKTVYIYNTARRMIHAEVDGRSFEQCNLDDIRERLTLTKDAARLRMDAGADLCLRCFPDSTLEGVSKMASEPYGAAPTVDNMHPTGETPLKKGVDPKDPADRLQHVNPDVPEERFETSEDPSEPDPPAHEPGTTR